MQKKIIYHVIIIVIYTSVNTGAIAPVCTHFLNYIKNWWYCNVINLINKIKVYL